MTLPFNASWVFTGSRGRALLWLAAVIGLLSCGGGGGGGAPSEREPRAEGVYSGFEPRVPGITLEQALNWEHSSTGAGDGGVGAGADGDGGVGAGGDFGQFRNALLIVKYPDGSSVGNGQALTDATTGMVTIVPRKGYAGALHLELRGTVGATYFEEGRDTFVPFPEGQVIRAIIPAISGNIGITPFSEAAYRLLTEGSTTERAINPARPTATEIANANAKVREILNKQFPATLSVDDITRLPFIKSPTIGAGSIGIDARGRYGLVNGAFSKQAAMFNPNRSQPTLDAVAQLGADLLDGTLDGMNGSQSAAAAAARTYDPNTLAGELSSALAEQSYRFGTDVAKGALPKVVNFANSRHQGYLFDASITADGKALDTVSGWEGDNGSGYAVGQSFNKLPAEARVYGVFGNLGHGSLFFKTNSANSQAKIFAIGDNVNGELGLGNTTPTGSTPVQVTLPGAPTHMAGGFAHTVARMADGSVYAWGDNSFGQLGNGGTTGSTTPLLVSLPRGAIAVAAANTASYALLDDGSVYTWGSSDRFGLLGDGDKNSVSLAPTPITALSQVVQITARDHDVAVLRRDGSVWHWGSFPADAAVPFAGGTPLPQPLVGLPAGVPIRKILSEQGVFAVLMADGSVYEWGVYFDTAAGTILRDIQARRALNVPPLRDMMPGGYVGYGVRAFDRLTAMGVDYRGGMWKVRGRVAEEFNPADPALQRSPPGHAGGAACESCHAALTDWPLTPAAPTTADVCVPQSAVHGAGATSFIRDGTTCEKCHNPNLQPPVQMFPNGWLTCVKPSNLPPPNPPTLPPTLTTACTIPAGHVFTPPGTVCAACHNSIIARPLQGCAQPPSSALPTIPTTTAITTAVDDAGGTIGNGTLTTDNTPELRGTVASALAAGQSVSVLRDGTAIGTATLSGTNWSFVDPGAPNGAVTYTARVNTSTGFGPTSNAYQISITVPTVNLTAATQRVAEGTVATITAQLSSASSRAVTVPFTVGGTAGNPGDYTISVGPLTIAAGSTTGTITVTVNTDTVAEPDETVIVTLGTPTNAALGATTVHTLTIAGQVPVVNFTAATQRVNEGTVATITAQLSSASSQTVTVPFTVSGTASNPADYIISAGPLTIAAGSTSATITVTAVADAVAEPDETVIVTLGTPTNAALGAATVHTLTIAGQDPVVSFTAAAQRVVEGTVATITAQLSSASSQTVTVPFTVGGTASNPADYTISAGPLTIAAGSTTGTITVTVNTDTVAEPDETVVVTLGTPTNAILGATTVHTLTVAAQPPPTVSFSAGAQTVAEGTIATITAQLSSASSQTVTVPFTVGGTASNPADYTISAGPLTIAAGSTSATITVTVVADTVAEPDETVIVTLGTPTNAALGATTVHTLTIAGQVPVVNFTAATQTVNEGTVATITAQLSSASSQTVTVPFTAGGTASNPADYTISVAPLTIAAGSTTGTITVTVSTDALAEPNETVIVTLGTPTNAVLGATTVHTLTIAGQVPVVNFTAATQTVNEGTVATITAQLSLPSTQAVTVPFTVGGTAGNPADYTISASPLTIAAGNTTATVTVTVVADGVAEPQETVVVTMGTPTNATLGTITVHTLTIAGQTPTVSFTAAAQSVSEGVGTAAITAQLSGPSTQTVTVPFTVGGTATNPADYTISASPLTIAAGNTTATVTVTVVADGVAEPNETVVVTMGTPTNATLGQTTVHTLTIAAQLPTVSFTAAAQSVSEGVGTATITAQLSLPSTQTVTVPFTVGGTATNPADYTISASPLTIPAGNTTGTVTVTVVADGVTEPNETVVVTMGTPTNATLGATTVHTMTIIGVNPPPVLSNISYSQLGAINTCNIFGGPLGTRFLVSYSYSDAGGDVRIGATTFVSYVFSNGPSGSFDDTQFTTIGGDGFTGTMNSEMCFLFGPATFVNVTITVTDLAGFVSQPIPVTILRPQGAN